MHGVVDEAAWGGQKADHEGQECKLQNLTSRKWKSLKILIGK